MGLVFFLLEPPEVAHEINADGGRYIFLVIGGRKNGLKSIKAILNPGTDIGVNHLQISALTILGMLSPRFWQASDATRQREF